MPLMTVVDQPDAVNLGSSSALFIRKLGDLALKIRRDGVDKIDRRIEPKTNRTHLFDTYCRTARVRERTGLLSFGSSTYVDVHYGCTRKYIHSFGVCLSTHAVVLCVTVPGNKRISLRSLQLRYC